MSNHAHLNNLISEIKVTKDTAYKTFFSVASQIFADGNVNWGRICTLFYFAYKLAIQVLKELPLLDIIIAWVKKFVFQKLASWISDRGGWVSLSKFSTYCHLLKKHNRIGYITLLQMYFVFKMKK